MSMEVDAKLEIFYLENFQRIVASGQCGHFGYEHVQSQVIQDWSASHHLTIINLIWYVELWREESVMYIASNSNKANRHNFCVNLEMG